MFELRAKWAGFVVYCHGKIKQRDIHILSDFMGWVLMGGVLFTYMIMISSDLIG
jgi:hypothetical protein